MHAGFTPQVEPAARPAELLPLMQHALGASPELSDDERRELLAAFAATDVTDLPTFNRAVERLANDRACLLKRRLAAQQQAVLAV